jgi:hypothetical protein
LKRLVHAVGFDDAPFERTHRGDVLVVGAICSGARLDGVLSGAVRRDGANSTRVLADLIGRSRFRGHLQAILLQGIALAGFNVVNIHALHESTRCRSSWSRGDRPTWQRFAARSSAAFAAARASGS